MLFPRIRLDALFLFGHSELYLSCGREMPWFAAPEAHYRFGPELITISAQRIQIDPGACSGPKPAVACVIQEVSIFVYRPSEDAAPKVRRGTLLIGRPVVILL